METLKNYLETMFLQLPNTKEVLRAKRELLQMMEDKYNELKAEGVAENEAVATVLSEFGNLDEVAESLGIKEVVGKDPVDRRMVKMDEIKEYISFRATAALRIAIGVALCIVSPLPVIYFGDMVNGGDFSEVLGVLGMFALIAVAVGLFVFTGIQDSKYEYMEKQVCAVDFASIDYVNNEKNQYRPVKAVLLIVGIVCIILSIPFTAFLSFINDDLAGMGFLAIVALGVGIIVYASVKDSAFDKILSLNDSGTVGGNYTDQQKRYAHLTKTGKTVMSVFWPTVTCVYLMISFITASWHITWIIWPVAPFISKALESIFYDENGELK